MIAVSRGRGAENPLKKASRAIVAKQRGMCVAAKKRAAVGTFMNERVRDRRIAVRFVEPARDRSGTVCTCVECWLNSSR
jgi:hypothetical protein